MYVSYICCNIYHHIKYCKNTFLYKKGDIGVYRSWMVCKNTFLYKQGDMIGIYRQEVMDGTL